MSTDLHFCNFCQQSVPQDKVDSGDAVRHGGRVVCPTCCDTLLLATANRGDEVKPTSLVVPLVVGFVGWGLAAFAWFSHDQYRRGNEERLEDRRLNNDNAITRLIEKQEAAGDREAERHRELTAAVGALREDLEGRDASRAAAIEKVQIALEPLEPLRDAHEQTAAAVTEVQTRLKLVEESLQETRTQQEFLRDEIANLSRIAATSGPPQPGEGDFSKPVLALLERIQDDDAVTRAEALEAIGKERDPRLAQYVEPLLADTYEMNRFYAAYALGEMGAVAVCGGLIKTLGDDYSFVRKAAFEALQKLTGHSAPFDHKGAENVRVEQQKVWQDWWTASKDALLAAQPAG